MASINQLGRIQPNKITLKLQIQEVQHPLTGQRAANFRRDLEAT